MADTMLKNLPQTISVEDTDEMLVWSGTGNAKRAAKSEIVAKERDAIKTMTVNSVLASKLAIAANGTAELSIPYTVPSGFRLVAVLNVVTNFPGIRIENYYPDPNTSTIKVVCVNTLSAAQTISLRAFVLIVKTI